MNLFGAKGGMPLRKYQLEAKDQTIVGFEESGKGLVVIPTGGGKTILFAHLAQHWQPKRTLILAHREELLQQAVEKIEAATGMWAEIEKAERKASFDAPVVVASVQTLARRADRWPQDHFGLVVVDEAHHVLADSYLNVLRHFDGHAKVLGVTATPDRGDKKNLGKYFERVFFEVTLARLIKDGFLSPLVVKMLPVKIDLSGVKSVAGDYSADEVGARIEPWLERVAVEMGHECWDRKSIVFLPLVKTAERMTKLLNERGIECRSVSGYDDHRAETLRWFAKAGPGSAICNSMLLTEGFDQPDVDCIVNLRPTKVRALYAQMVGRGTRLSPGKANCLLLDFLWQSEKLSLVSAAHLFASNDDAAKDAQAQFVASLDAGGGGEMDVMQICETVEEQRMKKVIAALKENRKRPAGTHDAVAMCMSIGAADLMRYEPSSEREAKPATKGQLAHLQSVGIDPGSITCFGQASAMLDRLAVRKMEGYASPKQVRLLEKLGHPDAGSMGFAQAQALIGDFMASRGRGAR